MSDPNKPPPPEAEANLLPDDKANIIIHQSVMVGAATLEIDLEALRRHSELILSRGDALMPEAHATRQEWVQAREWIQRQLRLNIALIEVKSAMQDLLPAGLPQQTPDGP